VVLAGLAFPAYGTISDVKVEKKSPQKLEQVVEKEIKEVEEKKEDKLAKVDYSKLSDNKYFQELCSKKELTKEEKKDFERFEKGYENYRIQGLKAAYAKHLGKKAEEVNDDEILPLDSKVVDSIKDSYNFIKKTAATNKRTGDMKKVNETINEKTKETKE
jgi:hypothetical protein